MPFVKGSVKPTVITYLCGTIQRSSQIHFVSEHRHKKCCIYILNQRFFIQNRECKLPLAISRISWGFPKAAWKREIAAYFVFFTALNQELYWGARFLQIPWAERCVYGDTNEGQTVSSSSDVHKLLSPA